VDQLRRALLGGERCPGEAGGGRDRRADRRGHFLDGNRDGLRLVESKDLRDRGADCGTVSVAAVSGRYRVDHDRAGRLAPPTALACPEADLRRVRARLN